MSPVLQEQDDRLRGLINMGKERGYVLFDEVNEVLPGETRTAAEVDGLFSAFEGHNIRICEDAPVAMPASGLPGVAEHGESEAGEDSVHVEEPELNDTASFPDKTSDPVRLYLREMGSVRLLKREEEVAHRQAHGARPSAGAQDRFSFSACPRRADRNGQGVAQRYTFD